MGLRSWYTPVYTYETFKKVVKSIKNNPYAYGIHFILKLYKDASPFKAKGLLIAWSGDGSSSLEHLKPLESRAETCLLDNLSSKFIKNPPLFTQGWEKCCNKLQQKIRKTCLLLFQKTTYPLFQDLE